MGSLSPADYIISLFGGVRATARALDRTPSTVSDWRLSKERGGTGGEIPRAVQRRILQIAKERGLDITESHLIWGPKQ